MKLIRTVISRALSICQAKSSLCANSQDPFNTSTRWGPLSQPCQHGDQAACGFRCVAVAVGLLCPPKLPSKAAGSDRVVCALPRREGSEGPQLPGARAASRHASRHTEKLYRMLVVDPELHLLVMSTKALREPAAGATQFLSLLSFVISLSSRAF